MIRSSLVPCFVIVIIGCGEQPPAGPPPPVVSTATAATRDVPIYIEFAGTLDSYVNAEIRARVSRHARGTALS